MADRPYIESGSSSKKTIVRGLLLATVSLVLLYVSCVLCLIGAHFVQFGINDRSIEEISKALLVLKNNPLYIMEAYAEWWGVFRLAFQFGQLNSASFLPLAAPILFVIIWVWIFVKSPYSFKLWYKLNNRFAKLEDIENMGLLKGYLMALGKFQGRILRLSKPLSVFGWGSPGLGKTTTVAIPSILESDNAGIVAVDCKGTLAKFTSGYRSTLGKVFYFNWNFVDNPELGEFWPRWNPFSGKNLPPKGHERDCYLNLISRYILSNEHNNYWEKLASIALEGLLQFFVSKTEQAYANDYFLSELLDNGKLRNEDKDILLSYYALMPPAYARPAIKHLNEGTLNVDNYLPIGSWDNIPNLWQGKEFCFAMLNDCLIQRFYTVRNEEENKEMGRWKKMLYGFIKESEFFGYHPRANQVLQHLFYLTKKQRKIIFSMMLEPLSAFRKNSVRERTSMSDLSFAEVRGNRQSDGSFDVTTVYMVADNKHSSLMTRFFTDMIINANLENHRSMAPLPLMFVMDDFEILPKFHALQEGLVHGPEARMSFLLLTDNLKNVHNSYGVDGLEEIISNTSYKLLFAENNKSLSQHFNQLAIYGTKSVQIPAVDTGAFLKVKQGFADAHYYDRIAKDLLGKNKAGLVRKGQHLLLAQGFYHLPACINALFFLCEEPLKEKATIDTAYFLDNDMLADRNAQDVDSPTLLEVLNDAGVQVEREEDIDAYLNDQYAEVADVIKNPQDKKSALAEDISQRWASSRYQEEEDNGTSSKKKFGDDWWMSEEFFSIGGKGGENPFEKH